MRLRSLGGASFLCRSFGHKLGRRFRNLCTLGSSLAPHCSSPHVDGRSKHTPTHPVKGFWPTLPTPHVARENPSALESALKIWWLQMSRDHQPVFTSAIFDPLYRCRYFIKSYKQTIHKRALRRAPRRAKVEAKRPNIHKVMAS